MFRKTQGILLFAVLLSPVSIHAQSALADVDYGVLAGDEISIRVFRADGVQLEEVSGTRLVDPDGQIFLPYVGTFHAEGLSAPEIRARLEEAYSALYSTPVVEVSTRIKVNVTGAVRSPGHYLMDPSSTIIDALARAGGVSSEVSNNSGVASDAAASRFVRNGRLYLLDLRPNAPDPSVFSLPVQSSDWIHIPIAERSRVREEIQFWGGVVSLVTGTVALIVLIGK